MAHVCGLNCFYFKNRQELVLAEFEEGIPFATIEFFQIEDILVKRDRFLDVINLDRDVIASIHLHAHFLIYICRTRTQKVRSTWMSSVISLFFVGLPVTQILKGFRGLLSTPECAGRGRFECGRRETIFLVAPVLR